MIINKIILTNFRNHKYKEIEFSSGINLLHGPNGSGKTSILEAIGHTLFGSKFRTTADESITEGESKGKVYIEFTVGETKYIVEKNLPSGSGKLYSVDDKALKITGKEGIRTKIHELLGIKIESDDFFSNIIVASQNKITDIFVGTPKELRKRFDNLFDTGIYRAISEGYLKISEDKYKFELSQLNEKLSELSNLIIDSQELNSQLSELSGKSDSLLNQKKVIEDNQKDIESEINKLKDIKNKIDTTKNSLVVNDERISECNKRLIELKSDQAKAESSKIIVDNNKEEYHKHNQLAEEIAKIEIVVSDLEKDVKKMAQLKSELAENERNISSLESEEIEKNKRLDELRLELEDLGLTIAQINIQKDAYLNQVTKFQYNLDKLTTIISEIDIEESRVQNYEKMINDSKVEISSLEKNMIDDESIKLKLNVAKTNIEDLILFFEQQKSLNIELSEKNTRIDESKEAQSTLSNGLCPFLAEDCQNLKQGTSVSGYFANKIANYRNEISVIEAKLLQLSQIEKQDKELRNDISKCEQLLATNEISRLRIENLNNEVEKSQLKIESDNLKIAIIISQNQTLINELSHNSQIKSSRELQPFSEKLSSDIKQISALLLEKNNQCKSAETNLESKIKNRDEIVSRVSIIQSKLANLNSASGQLVLKINDLQIKTNELDSLKASLNENKNDLKSLSLAYTLYIKNLDLANSIEDIVNKIQSENNNLSLLIEKSTEFANILNEIECNYSEEVYHQKSSKHETIKEELRNCETVINSISIEINTLNIKIEGNSINIDKFQKAQTKKFEIEKKIELTSLIRNNLKIMGQVIANKLLERIQVVATDNFQMISNRNDSVLWKSDLDEAYRVGIKFQDNRLRNFELLSGGEQMMVAISLRAAMNSLLTNSKFVIFDEPTVNLDTERRKALSESLKYILKSLDQAIIVTHDDTFMELAQNNIELQ